MNLLFVVSWYSSKNADVFREGIFHYEQLCSLKKYCNVAIYFPYDNSLESEFSDAVEHGIRVFRRNNNNCGRIARRLNYLSDYITIKKRFFPDVIHAHVAQGAGRVAFLWKKVFGTPYILTEHAPVEMMGFKSKRNIFISKCVYKNSWHNVCVSIDLAKKLRSFFPKERFDVIYNGVVSPKALIAQNKYEIDIHHKINCGIVAAFYDKEIKGFQFLLPAIKQVSERGIDICLHICGGGKYLSFYENMAKELGISERCFFYGQLDKKKVYSIVSQMNFMISASLYESAGVSAEEAMLLGKPMLVTRSGGVNSLVPTNVSVVVDKGSTKCLVDGFEKMIQNYTSYDSEFIMNYAYENFDIEVISKKYMDLYNNLMLKRK